LVYLHKERGFAAFLHKNELVEFKTISFEHAGSWQRVKDYFLSLSENAETIPWIAIGDSTLLEKDDLPSASMSTEAEYALPIGIALDALYSDKNSVQFLKDDLKPAALKKKERKIVNLSLFFLCFSLLILGPIGFGLLSKHKQTLVPRAQKSLEKLGLPSHEEEIEKLLDTLAFEKSELEQEKKFGPHFPMASWFLDRIFLALKEIDANQLPQLKSLEYRLDAIGNPQLHIAWTCANKETAKLIKRNFQAQEGLRIAKWKEQSQTYSITLEKL
jgi:hypothetical protein